MQDLTNSEGVQIEKVSVPLVPNLGTKESASGSISDHQEKLPANDVMVNDAQGETLGHLATGTYSIIMNWLAPTKGTYYLHEQMFVVIWLYLVSLCSGIYCSHLGL